MTTEIESLAGGEGAAEAGRELSPDPAFYSRGIHLPGGEMLQWSDFDRHAAVATGPVVHALFEQATRGAQRLLVLGALEPTLILAAAERIPEVHVIVRGYPDAEALRQGAGGQPGLTITCGDPLRVPAHGDYDVVVCFAGLESLATPDGLLAEPLGLLNHVLGFVAPLGRFVVAIENVGGLHRVIDASVGQRDDDDRRWPARLGVSAEPSVSATIDDLYANGFERIRCAALYPSHLTPTMSIEAALLDRSDVPEVIVSACGRAMATPFADRPVLLDPTEHTEEVVSAGLGFAVAPGVLLVGERGAESEVASGLLCGDGDIAATWQTLQVWTPSDGGDESAWHRSVSEVDGKARFLADLARDPGKLAGPVPVGDVVVRRWMALARDLDQVALRREVSDYAAWMRAEHAAGKERAGSLIAATPDGGVKSPDGSYLLVDPSWRWTSPVDIELLLVMHLRSFAARLLSSGHRHPWPVSVSVDQVVAALLEPENSGWHEALARATWFEAAFVTVLKGLDPVAEADFARARHAAYTSPGGMVGTYSRGRREAIAEAIRLSTENEELIRQVAWLDARIALRTKQWSEAEERNVELRDSVSFKIGRVLTAPFRAVAKIIGRAFGSARRK